MTERTENGAEALLGRIARQGIILFGTGYVAGLWARILRGRGLWDAVRCFTVSDAPAGTRFAGLPVYAWKDAPFRRTEGDLPLLGVAVHESLRDVLMPRLTEEYPGECVFLYPWLFEAAFGRPEREGEVSLTELLAAQPAENRWITVRYNALRAHRAAREDGGPARAYAAALERFRPDHTGEEIYLAVQGLFSGKATASKRLARFLDLAGRPDRAEILRANPILLDTENRVIDGLHRIALARCDGIRTLPCRVVPASERYGEFFPERNRATENARREAGLTRADGAMLDFMKEELLHG